MTQPIRILVVEDHPVNQAVALTFLKRLGQSADMVASGAEAIEKVRLNPYDVILMDIHMPGMDGIQATRAIRELSLDHQPRIVAFTAHTVGLDREQCLQAGMDDFLFKPLRLDALLAALRGVFEGGGEQSGEPG
jgi:CheY-like chemotaxis protein